MNGVTEQDLLSLIGSEETMRLEFKSGGLFADKSSGRIAEDLSEAVSAFANALGGRIILGEKRGKVRVATASHGRGRHPVVD